MANSAIKVLARKADNISEVVDCPLVSDEFFQLLIVEIHRYHVKNRYKAVGSYNNDRSQDIFNLEYNPHMEIIFAKVIIRNIRRQILQSIHLFNMMA